MGRKPRELVSGAAYEVHSQCLNREGLMKDNSIKDLMCEVIIEAQKRYKFELYTFEILDNQFHFVIKSTNSTDTISKIMQRIKSVFAKRYNKIHGRIGPFWNERFYCSIIEKLSENTLKYAIH